MPSPTLQAVAIGATKLGIELIELETFISVARAGSFSAAAVLLHVTQPTVTGRIQRLESALGAQLLRRTTRKVEMTPQGAALLTEAAKALDGLSRLVLAFRNKANLARQRVVVAATPTLAALTLPAIVQAYSKRFPDVDVQLLDLQYSGVLAAIDDGSADLGVMAFEGMDTRYKFQHLWTDDMLLVVPQGHALAKLNSVGPKKLAAYPLIMVDQHQGVRARIAESLQREGLALPPAKVVANLNTLLGMLNVGMGVALLPRSIAVRGIVAKHALVEIEGVDLTRQFGIVMARRSKLNAAGQSFSRHLKQSTATSFDRTGVR